MKSLKYSNELVINNFAATLSYSKRSNRIRNAHQRCISIVEPKKNTPKHIQNKKYKNI